MTSADGLTCALLPGVERHGPGWYLVSVGERWREGDPVLGIVECGPLASEEAAYRMAEFMDENALGVHPAPWIPRWSARGLVIGSRLRPHRPRRSSE